MSSDIWDKKLCILVLIQLAGYQSNPYIRTQPAFHTESTVEELKTKTIFNQKYKIGLLCKLTIFNNVCYVKYLRRQYSWIHLIVFPESRHLNDKTGRNLLEFYIRRVKALFKQLLDTR